MSTRPPTGPGTPFEVLVDDDPRAGLGLPEGFRAIYGGDWCLPSPTARPHVVVNFVMSHDGRVSFVPEAVGGGAVSGSNRHDVWLMGLLRARADVVLMGAGTLRDEPDHVWTAEHLPTGDAAAFSALRAAEGRTPVALHVFVTGSGRLPASAAVFAAEVPVLVATTTAGGRAARRALPARVEVADLGEDRVDLGALLVALRERGAHVVLSEGGPHLHGGMLADGLVDEEFLTWSPVVAGADDDHRRPGLVEGVRFRPGESPLARLRSVRRAGDHLFVRCGF